MNDLAITSYQTYKDFKNHEMFVPYLERMSTLKYYAKRTLEADHQDEQNLAH